MLLMCVAAVIAGAVATTALVPLREDAPIPKTCSMDRVYKMIGYDCSDMRLNEVPQHLRTNVQVKNQTKRIHHLFHFSIIK